MQPWSRIVALALLVLWGGFWTFFILADGLSDRAGAARLIVMTGIVLGLTATGLWLVWTRPIAGAVFCLAVGALLVALQIFYLHNPLPTAVFLFLTMALPPLLAGVLALWRLAADAE